MCRRHDLLRVEPDSWPDVLAGSPCVADLAKEPRLLVEGWAQRGWPVIVRRGAPCSEGEDIAVGLPLPPSHGKLRLALRISAGVATMAVAPVSLRDAKASAPAEWSAQIDGLLLLAQRLSLVPTVFGALLWQHLTGLPYLGPRSDIDLIWAVSDGDAMLLLLDGLAGLDALGPARLDGELVLDAGGGVNWRELRSAFRLPAGEVLVKHMGGVDVRCAHALFA